MLVRLRRRRMRLPQPANKAWMYERKQLKEARSLKLGVLSWAVRF